MNDDLQGYSGAMSRLLREVNGKVSRKLRARVTKRSSVWHGLGIFGLVGWSITLPILLGVAGGLWLDAHFPSQFSWTVSLLFLGATLGCVSAWHWVQRENEKIRREAEEDRDEASKE